MKTLILFSLILLGPINLRAEERESFGNAPTSQNAVDLVAKIVDIYQKDGHEKALKFLDLEGMKFIKDGTALERYDFFKKLRAEAIFREGRRDLLWATHLSEWIYDFSRNVGEEFWLKRIIKDLYPLYYASGRYGDARRVLTNERIRLAEGPGTSVEIDSMTATGPAEKNFPEFQKRVMPKTLIHKSYSKLMSFLAVQDLAEGKWKRAMEEAWIAKTKGISGGRWYSERPHLTDSKAMISELADLRRKGAWVLGQAYQFLGLYEMELKENSGIVEIDQGQGWGTHTVQIAEARVAYLEYALGKKDASVLKVLEELRKTIAENYKAAIDDQHRVTLWMADIHFSEGDADSGWKLVDGLRLDESLNTGIQAEVLEEWCRHRVREGRLEKVEEELQSLLEKARSFGLKRKEIQLYQIYADFLSAAGRYDEALFMQRELLRLLKSFDVYTRVPEALAGLARIYALRGNRAEAERILQDAQKSLEGRTSTDRLNERIKKALSRPLPEANSEREMVLKMGTDLQPKRAMTSPLDGFSSRGFFTLTNLSSKTQIGVLKVNGTGVKLLDKEVEEVIRIGVGLAGVGPLLQERVTLEAESQIHIELESQNENEKEVEISWLPDEGSPQKSKWFSTASEGDENSAIVDAGDYADNPFYLVPIFHLLQYRDADGFHRAFDIKVKSSEPARIELYDGDDQLVFVDANGDGDFDDEGDIVMNDLNLNHQPDLKIDSEESEHRFVVFVKALNQIPAEGLEINIMGREEGKWEVFAQDRIVLE